MSERKKSPPDLSLYFQILKALEASQAPYVVIGGFAATMYGITRATFDIDIVVDLQTEHINELAKAFPSPRFYADPNQMLYAMRKGSMFNIIDSQTGEKADVFPISMDERYRPALNNKVRHSLEDFHIGLFEFWAARIEDVITGKLLALAELSTPRHEYDIFEMLYLHFLEESDFPKQGVDTTYITNFAAQLGNESLKQWSKLLQDAKIASGHIDL